MPSFAKLKFESASWARGPAQLRQDDFFFFFLTSPLFFSLFSEKIRTREGFDLVSLAASCFLFPFLFFSAYFARKSPKIPLISRQRRSLQQLLLLEALLQGSKTAPSNPERDILFCSTMAGTEQKHPREKLAWLPCLKIVLSSSSRKKNETREQIS